MMSRYIIVISIITKGQNIVLHIIDGCLATRQKWTNSLPSLIKRLLQQQKITYLLDCIQLPEGHIGVSIYDLI